MYEALNLASNAYFLAQLICFLKTQDEQCRKRHQTQAFSSPIAQQLATRQIQADTPAADLDLVVATAVVESPGDRAGALPLATANTTSPTGLPALPPLGPAMPVTATPRSAPRRCPTPDGHGLGDRRSRLRGVANQTWTRPEARA